MADKQKSLAGLDAKTYERIGNRLTLPSTYETLRRQKNDALGNIKRELKSEGQTGRLTSPDGLARIKPFKHKGFVIELFGGIGYESPLDIYGKQSWSGTAEGNIMQKGKEIKIIYDTEPIMPHGFETPHEAANYLINLIDLYRNPESVKRSA